MSNASGGEQSAQGWTSPFELALGSPELDRAPIIEPEPVIGPGVDDTMLDHVEAFRRRTISLVDEITETGKRFNLPPSSAALAVCRKRIEENRYQVLVVGEMKRGKSTFVNALIGQNILPTDVDVATCQVFRVAKAETEGYRLRFEDNSTQEITLNDLPRYGSQVLADKGEAPRPSDVIRWIEVDVPVQFLPDGVSLLDTPGLGSLYAGHSQITQRFVPLADAVIYVLKSHRPLGEDDAKIIDKILTATRNLFFIQTKIDQVRRDNWQSILDRNEALLHEHFDDRLADPRIWPISSTNLMKAAATGDADYLRVSRHRELAAALDAFLFRAAGLIRAAEAGLLMQEHHAEGMRVLTTRAAALSEESKQKHGRIQEELAERRRRFEAEWGPAGRARHDLTTNLQRIVSINQAAFVQTIQPNGTIEWAARQKIDGVSSLSEVRLVAQDLQGEIAGAAVDKWQEVCRTAQAQCMELVGPLLVASNALFVDESLPLQADAVSVGEESALGRHFDRAKAGFGNSLGTLPEEVTRMLVVWFATLSERVIVALGSRLPLVAVGVAAGAAVWAFFRGGFKQKESEIRSAKQEAHRYLQNLMQTVRQRFLFVDLASGRKCLVDDYFEALSNTVQELVRVIADAKVRDAKAEERSLLENAKLEEAERAARLQAATQQVAEWREVGQRLNALAAAFAAIDRDLSQAAAARPAA